MTPPPPSPSRTPAGSSGPLGGRNATIAAVVVAVVAVIAGFVVIGILVKGGSNSPSAAQVQHTPQATPTAPAGHTITPPTTPPATTTPTTPPNTVALHCSAPPPIPKNPQKWKTPPPKTIAQNAMWTVTLKTNCGDITMDLNGKVAPETVSSFLFLSQHHYFDNTKCHRLTLASQGLSVLQCGDPTGTGTGGPGYGYGIENAPANGQYPTGTVAMARTSDPNSNGSQFFIVYAPTTLPTTGGGYSIFGNVTKGLDIVQAIAAKGLAADGESPKQPISILSVAYSKA